MRIRLAIVAAPFALVFYSAPALAAAKDMGGAAPSEAQLARGRQASIRRGLVFVDAGFGAAYVDLVALKGGELLDSARWKSSGFGLITGAAFGVRLQEFTLAVRYRYGDFSDWHLWTLGGDAGMHFSFARFEPYFGFGAGYASVGGILADTSNAVTMDPPPAVDIRGLNVRVNVGLSYYFSRWFSLGANLSGEAFFLHREGDRLGRLRRTDPNASPPFPYAMNGSGNGLGATLSLVLGAHY
jgi:hypothetical protein